MIIYSVEIYIDKDIEKNWCKWMEEVHIPDVMSTDLFLDFKFFKNILNAENPSYTIQYKLKNITDYHHYQNVFASELKQDHDEKFKNKFVAKRQVFQIIKE